MSDNIIPLRASNSRAQFLPSAVLALIMGDPTGRRGSPPVVITVPGLERLKEAAERASCGSSITRAAAMRSSLLQADAMAAVAYWHVAEEADGEFTAADMKAAKAAMAACDRAGALAADDGDDQAAGTWFKVADFVRDQVLEEMTWRKFCVGMAG